jgi:inward rectifier potassium channel
MGARGQRPDAGSDVERIGARPHLWDDLYHRVITASWPRFVIGVVASYVIINVFFASLYLAAGDAIEGARPGSFADAFFFSVQTMATIGYGKMVPQGPIGNALVTIEALVGLISLAMATSLLFAKFARPRAHVTWSDHCVVTSMNGVPTLMLRLANDRSSRIVEAQMRLVLLRQETTAEGETMRRFYDLALVRDRTATFALSWTVMHPITESSPLHGETPESLRAKDAGLTASMIGLEEELASTVHARQYYPADKVLFGYRFVDIMSRHGDKRRLDLSKLHDVEPAPARPAARRPAHASGEKTS